MNLKEELFMEYIKEGRRMSQAIEIADFQLIESRMKRREEILSKIESLDMDAFPDKRDQVKKQIEDIDKENLLLMKELKEKCNEEYKGLRKHKEEIGNRKKIRKQYLYGDTLNRKSKFDFKT